MQVVFVSLLVVPGEEREREVRQEPGTACGFRGLNLHSALQCDDRQIEISPIVPSVETGYPSTAEPAERGCPDRGGCPASSDHLLKCIDRLVQVLTATSRFEPRRESRCHVVLDVCLQLAVPEVTGRLPP